MRPGWQNNRVLTQPPKYCVDFDIYVLCILIFTILHKLLSIYSQQHEVWYNEKVNLKLLCMESRL
jgi:hypothetical protein